MSKVALALDKNPPEFYAAADVVGLIYHHPLLEARLSRYPAFLGLAERPEFQDLGSDMQFAELRQKQASLAELLDYPKVQAMVQNADLQKTIKDTVIPNLADLQGFLTNGVSQKFDEKILGRWEFDLNSSVMLLRKSKPNMSPTEMRKWKAFLASSYAKASLVATTEEQAFLKNMPRGGGQPGGLQKMEGQWKSSGDNYTFSMTADGKPLELTAHVQLDRLTLSGAAALSHDLWVNVVRGGEAPESEQLKVARGATVLLGIVSVVLGIAFKGQNVAYMVGLAFAIAASANFPALVLSVFWRPFTTRAAQASMLVGTASALLLIYLSPTIQMQMLGHASAPFPLKNPGLVTIPLSFLVGVAVSLLFPEREADEAFAAMQIRLHLGAD